ncbi:MAG: HlyC/CorC family transporter [Alphaproteobacteria bacterium]|nr:HlyC/CorC family transporter [Alphaproteobacteria bacterium]
MADLPLASEEGAAEPVAGDGPVQTGLLAALVQKLQGLVSRRADGEGQTLEAVLEEHLESDRVFSKEERRMLMNLLKFGELRVDDVMVPRADIEAVEASTGLADVLKIFSEAGHSRLPLYRETLDDPLGMVHIKDVVVFLAETGCGPETQEEARRRFALARLKRDVLFVPRSMPAIDLLLKMQSSRIHLALVIDEYGGTDGLVSIEDLVEGIVGDIEDEHDTEDHPRFARNPDGTVDVDARMDIEELEETLGLTLVTEEREEDVDTLGGLVVSLVGRVPQRGELVAHGSGLEFEILDADVRRLKRVRLHLSGHAPPPAE